MTGLEIAFVIGAALWNEAHNLGKAHAQAQATNISYKAQYCKPVTELPDSFPQWKIPLYKQQCKGMEGYLNDKIPESKLIEPITPDTVALPSVEVPAK